LKEDFDRLVEQNSSRDGFKHVLERRVPTRWNSDFTCLKSHLHFRYEVEQLTGASRNKLSAYRLTPSQWDLAIDLVEALAVCLLLFLSVKIA